MKRIILLIVSVAFLLGLGYAGYVVFVSKNIESVEVEGTIQSLYLIDETDEPNFQDAKLKVTYKTGDAKYILLSNANISVNDFSTSETNDENVVTRTMKITYKSKLIELNYSVIRDGLYYLSQTEKNTLDENEVLTEKEDYLITRANDFFYLGEEGKLKYYKYNSTENRWYLYDGKYKKTYRYEIVDDKVKVYLGGLAPNYQLQVKNINEKDTVTSTSYTYTGEFQTSKIVSCFTHYDVKTNSVIDNIDIISNNFKTKNDGNYKYLEFNVGDTFASTKNKVYFKLTYSTALIYATESGVPVEMLKELYVVIDDSMVKDNTLNTSKSNNDFFITALLAYDSKLCSLNFVVI